MDNNFLAVVGDGLEGNQLLASQLGGVDVEDELDGAVGGGRRELHGLLGHDGLAPAVYQNQSTCSIFNNEEIQIADVSSNMVRLLQSLISLIQNEKEELSIPDLTVMINVISHSIFFKDVSPGLIKRDVVSKAIDLIAKNYASPLTLKEVADQLFVNSSYLSCTFHRKTGVTFSSYLLDVRLTAAKDQLLTTNELISTVSVNSGFSSSAYFISCFKKKYGLTPYAFRKNSIKKNLE